MEGEAVEVIAVEVETEVMAEVVAATAVQAGTAVVTAEDHLRVDPHRHTIAVEVGEAAPEEIIVPVQDLILLVFKKCLQDSQLLV